MSALEKVRDGENFVLYKSGEDYLIKIENVRFSYPHFGEMQEQESEEGNKEKSWGGVAMLDKETHAAAKAQFDKILNNLLSRNKTKDGPAKVAAANRCIKDGDEHESPDMAGHWLISFKEKDARRRPGVRDEKGKPYLTDDGEIDVEKIDEVFYGGMYGSVLLRPWYFNGTARGKTKTYPKRLCCGFTGVQFLKKGEPFGQGRIDDSDAWGSSASSGSDPMDDDDDDI